MYASDVTVIAGNVFVNMNFHLILLQISVYNRALIISACQLGILEIKSVNLTQLMLFCCVKSF
jgi:hypothetical protein